MKITFFPTIYISVNVRRLSRGFGDKKTLNNSPTPQKESITKSISKTKFEHTYRKGQATTSRYVQISFVVLNSERTDGNSHFINKRNSYFTYTFTTFVVNLNFKQVKNLGCKSQVKIPRTDISGILGRKSL